MHVYITHYILHFKQNLIKFDYVEMETGSSQSQMNQCHGLDFKYYKSKDVSNAILYTFQIQETKYQK